MQARSSTLRKQPTWHRFVWTAGGLVSLAIAVIGIYLPGIPTTGPLLLASYLIGKGNPALRARLLEHPKLARYRDLLEGNRPFTLAQRMTAMLGMWSSISLSCLFLLWTAAGGWLAPAGCLLGGVIGSVVIMRFRRQPTGKTADRHQAAGFPLRRTSRSAGVRPAFAGQAAANAMGLTQKPVGR